MIATADSRIDRDSVRPTPAALTLAARDRVSCAAPGRANEDALGHGDRTAWVLDGATGLSDRSRLDAESDAAWYARTLGAALASASGPDDLAAWLAAALDESEQAYRQAAGTPPEDPLARPQCALHLARLDGDTARGGTLQLGHLCDVTAIVKTACGVVVRGGDPVHGLGDARNIAALHRLVSQGQAHADARRALWPELVAHRRRANAPSGYAAATPGLDVSPQLQQAHVPVAPGDHLLLVTDGLYALVDTWGRYTAAELVAAARTRGLADLAAELRRLESADLDMRAGPRLKPHDDASGLLLTIQAA